MDDGGKRFSWVGLYLDLLFVLAVGQLALTRTTSPSASGCS
jgi:low temperature requirement protein LtrA